MRHRLAPSDATAPARPKPNAHSAADASNTATAGRLDAGITLPEVLIVIGIMGILVTVLSMLVTVTFRQASGSEGRVTVARAEHSLGTWLPADLGSVDVSAVGAVDLDPAATPCGGSCDSVDLSGANVLQLSWNDDRPTTVQYQYINSGGQWDIQRIECSGGSCEVITVVADVVAPPDPTYDPAVSTVVPTWAIQVIAPPTGSDDRNTNIVTATVRLTGGGPTANAGGGSNEIRIAAGGIATDTIDADAFTNPTVSTAGSRCGGPITLIVDASISVGQRNMDHVIEPGVKAFIDAFRGTPSQLQIVRFSTVAQTMGPINATSDPTGWHRYIDMTDSASIDILRAQVGSLRSEGYTNWEDALFRALRNADASPAIVMPKRIVFFTDGVPNINRIDDHSGTLVDFNAGRYDTSKWGNSTSPSFDQESFDRTDVLLDLHTDVELVLVGVGTDFNNPSVTGNWRQNIATYTNPSAGPNPTDWKMGAEILELLMAGRGGGSVPAIYANGEYTNASTANFYRQDGFDRNGFAAAMKATAIKDCGGTITVDTKLADGTDVDDRFVYEHTETRDDDGTTLTGDIRQVSTSSSSDTGTFDFDIDSSSSYYEADIIVPQSQIREGFEQVGWSCTAGAETRNANLVDIGDDFDQLTVKVYPNEALYCVHTVAVSG